MADLFANADIRSRSTTEQIEVAEDELGIAFPPSYERFCLEYGYGIIDDLIAIYVPRDDIEDEASITVRSRALDDLQTECTRNWAEDGMRIGIDVWIGATPEMASRAFFFGQSNNGHWIFWDVQGNGEFDIYVCARGDEVRFGGRTLDEFIQRIRTDEVKTILGPGYAPLAGRFEGRD